MKIYNLIILSIFLVAITACSPQQAAESIALDAAEEAARGAAMEAKDVVEEKVDEELQDLVNFRCDVAGVQTFYFFKDKAKVASASGETWLETDHFYGQMDLADGSYLVEYPIEEATVTYSDMKAAYRSSKVVEGYECELDVVTEGDVTKPDLPIITPEELADKMLGEMSAAMMPTQ